MWHDYVNGYIFIVDRKNPTIAGDNCLANINKVASFNIESVKSAVLKANYKTREKVDPMEIKQPNGIRCFQVLIKCWHYTMERRGSNEAIEIQTAAR